MEETGYDLGPEILAYAAGIIDGEGCISITYASYRTGSPHFRLVVTVSNTNEDLVSWLQYMFGGSYHHYEDMKRPNQKPVYKWNLGTKASCEFLKMIQPYVLLKQEQIKLAFEFHERMGQQGKELSAEEIGKRQVIKDAMHILNKRGTKV